MVKTLELLLIALCLPLTYIQAQKTNNLANANDTSRITRIVPDTLPVEITTCKHGNPYRVRPTQLIIPGVLIGVGIIGVESDWLKYHYREIRDELQENIDNRLTFDDFSQYVPIVAVYGLNWCGVKGKHDFADRTIILGTAYAIMALSVNGLKMTTRVERPDGSSRNSFPSGHTATAFMGAEILRREYRDTSPWIGVAGYTVAIGTGFFRMYNNRHWLNDVLAGAGIGILSAEAAYWLYPAISETFFHKRYMKNIFISPYISSNWKGVCCQITLRHKFNTHLRK